MSRNAKQIIAVVVTIALLAIAWWGSYRPMRKAQMFIAALQNLQVNPPSSIQDLESQLQPALDYSSPIGQEELVRNMANSVLGFVQNSTSATTTAELITFLNSYYDPILARGKGMSFGQDLYLEGAINEMAFVKTQDPTYLAASIHWYEEANQLGPDRPQALYGLFDVYRFEGNVASTTAVAEKILSLWPTDPNVQQGLAQFLAEVASSTPASGSGK